MQVFLDSQVTTNGGIVACSGSNIVANAAKYHATPVVVCASLHSLTPTYIDQDRYLLSISPHSVVSFQDRILY